MSTHEIRIDPAYVPGHPESDTRTSESATSSEEESDGGVLGLLERIGSVIVPIGVALYAVLYLGVEEMYGVFGISRLIQAVRRRPWISALIAALWSGATYWGLFNLFGSLDIAIMVVVAVGLGILMFLVPFRLLRRKPVGRAGMKILVGGLTGEKN
ncbi:hypothetical protein [Nonomuraea sp. B19D2]|uniref:hypothetical protein n=1 Tax=Nonomuraea sp. B19D2 TaxID=3159561 RepID=UPI0032D9E147